MRKGEGGREGKRRTGGRRGEGGGGGGEGSLSDPKANLCSMVTLLCLSSPLFGLYFPELSQ